MRVPSPAGRPSSWLSRLGPSWEGTQSRATVWCRRSVRLSSTWTARRPRVTCTCALSSTRRGTNFPRSRRTVLWAGIVMPCRWRLVKGRSPYSVISASARPESGLTSSTTESWVGPAPMPTNHWPEEGTPQSWAVSGAVPKRRASNPGATSPVPRTTAAPSPEMRVTAPVDTATAVRSTPARTLSSPDAPLAVDTAPAGDAGPGAGHTTVASLSRVNAGGEFVWRTGGCCTSASTPTVASGITTASALTTSSRGVRRRRTTSPPLTRLPRLIRRLRGGASAASGVVRSAWSCAVLAAAPARSERGHAQHQHDQQSQPLDHQEADADRRARPVDGLEGDRRLDPPRAGGLALGPGLAQPVRGVEAGCHGCVVRLGEDEVTDAGRGQVRQNCGSRSRDQGSHVGPKPRV